MNEGEEEEDEEGDGEEEDEVFSLFAETEMTSYRLPIKHTSPPTLTRSPRVLPRSPSPSNSVLPPPLSIPFLPTSTPTPIPIPTGSANAIASAITTTTATTIASATSVGIMPPPPTPISLDRQFGWTIHHAPVGSSNGNSSSGSSAGGGSDGTGTGSSGGIDGIPPPTKSMFT